MQLSDLKNKKVTVMGIGLHGGGVGVIKFLAAQGAHILATDLRTAAQLKESLEKLKDLPVDFVLGQHRMEDFTDTQLVIKNPGVPEDSEYLAAARKIGIPIESDIGIFFDLCPAPIIGVTGTKGKSTTASLLAHIMRQHYPQVILAGNIRQSVLEKLPEITKDTIVILELSSWMLADAKEHKVSPYVAVMTNILEDHLNRYPDFKSYIDDKKLIFKFQKNKDYLFLNYSDPILKEFVKEARSKVYLYTAKSDELLNKELPPANQEIRFGAYAKSGKIFYGTNQEEICSVKDVKIIGKHNLANALAAISVARLYNVPDETIKNALETFKGIEGRLQLMAEVKKVKYINDTAATAPDAAIAALHAVKEHYNLKDKARIIVIAGGADKKLELKELGKEITQHCKAAILLEGTATPRLKKAIGNAFPTITFNSMEKAVLTASKIAQPGDVVLLSPGCASFGLFKHEFDRGDAFNKSVEDLKKINSSSAKIKVI